MTEDQRIKGVMAAIIFTSHDHPDGMYSNTELKTTVAMCVEITEQIFDCITFVDNERDKERKKTEN